MDSLDEDNGFRPIAESGARGDKHYCNVTI